MNQVRAGGKLSWRIRRFHLEALQKKLLKAQEADQKLAQELKESYAELETEQVAHKA